MTEGTAMGCKNSGDRGWSGWKFRSDRGEARFEINAENVERTTRYYSFEVYLR